MLVQINLMCATASSSKSTIKKGETVAIKISARNWLLGTVLSKGAKVVKVDTEEGVYEVDTSDINEFVKVVDLTHLKVREAKAAMKAKHTLSSLKKLQPTTTPKKSAPVSKPAKPVVEKTKRQTSPKQRQTLPNTGRFIKDTRSPGNELTDTTLPSELSSPEVYAQSLYGRVVNTGRKSSTTGQVVVVGTSVEKGKSVWVGFPRKAPISNARLLYLMEQHITDDMYKAPQVDFTDLKRYRKQARNLLDERNVRQSDIKARGEAVQQSLNLQVGDKALIKFSNGLYWKEILAVDHRKQLIYIQGSGTKRRTIPFALIQNTAKVS